MCDHEWLDGLLPHSAGVLVERIERTSAGVRVCARVGADGVPCWYCGTPARRVHSRYGRTLSGLPVTGQPVALRLRESADYGVATLVLLQLVQVGDELAVVFARCLQFGGAGHCAHTLLQHKRLVLGVW